MKKGKIMKITVIITAPLYPLQFVKLTLLRNRAREME